ncbi:hypothetical protein VVR12_07055 [Rothia sp. LK2588]|uniref:hypothetical protein n=1 Tax=Rothia sp. LK2588 TaxID=3114369 RepID=UPI0034CF43C7
MLEKDNIEQQAKEAAENVKNDDGKVIDQAQAQQSNVEADQQINDVRERFGK